MASQETGEAADRPSAEEAATVILVDDEPRLVELVGDYLESRGMTVVPCHDGPAALLAARTCVADVMVLDFMLPKIDGMEVCRRLRAEGSLLPVLMLSARGTVAERVASLERGADEYMVKPFALEELYARITVLLRRRQEPDDLNRVVSRNRVFAGSGTTRTSAATRSTST